MWYLFIKSAVSGIIVMVVSEVAKRSPSLGALIVSLPLVSVLAMIWLWEETKDSERLATHAYSTFWFVLPSLPMFLVLPALIRYGTGFYTALSIACALTIGLYIIMIWILGRYGITI